MASIAPSGTSWARPVGSRHWFAFGSRHGLPSVAVTGLAMLAVIGLTGVRRQGAHCVRRHRSLTHTPKHPYNPPSGVRLRLTSFAPTARHGLAFARRHRSLTHTPKHPYNPPPRGSRCSPSFESHPYTQTPIQPAVTGRVAFLHSFPYSSVETSFFDRKSYSPKITRRAVFARPQRGRARPRARAVPASSGRGPPWGSERRRAPPCAHSASPAASGNSEASSPRNRPT